MSLVDLSSFQLLSARRLFLAASVALVLAAPAAAQRDKPKMDVFVAPKGSTAEILEFIEGLTDEEPAGESEEELVAAQQKVLRSIAVAARQALEAGPATPDEEAQAHYYRLQALSLLVQLEEPGAVEGLEKALAAARASKVPEANAVGMKFYVENSFANWDSLTKKDRSDLVKAILAYLSTTPLDRNDVQTVMSVADFLAMQGEPELGAELVKKSLPLFQKSDFDRREAALESLAGLGRRLSLPGNKMELDGTLLNGRKLDWSQYEGQVVLVDFWATWCGPCRAELPNVLNMYKAYHNQGFDVLGVSLDDDPAQAAAFIEQMEIPWQTLFSEDPAARGWQAPLAVKYGVNGIPLAILLDREGKVVSMNARGATLKKLLFDMLGPPGKKTDKAAEKSAE